MINLRANNSSELSSLKMGFFPFLLIRSTATISKVNKLIKEIMSFAGSFNTKRIDLNISNISIEKL